MDNPELPKFPELRFFDDTSLTAFVHAAHGTDLQNRQSIAGQSFVMSGGCVSGKSQVFSSFCQHCAQSAFASEQKNANPHTVFCTQF